MCVCVHRYESVSGILLGQVSKNPYLPSKNLIHLFRKPSSNQQKGKNLTAECALTNYTAGKFISAIHSVTRCSTFIRICLKIFRKKDQQLEDKTIRSIHSKEHEQNGARNYYLYVYPCITLRRQVRENHADRSFLNYDIYK